MSNAIEGKVVVITGASSGLGEAAVETYGRIDVMLNNAGLMPHSPLERLKVEDWERMIDVNIKGVLYGVAAALPFMKEQKSGHFINVSPRRETPREQESTGVSE